MAGCIMIMAGGTGGHVFPALAVAHELQHRGWDVFWLGTRNSFESRVIPEQDISIEWVDIKGVRGKKLLQKLVVPFALLHAMFQAAKVIYRRKPDVVLGMGGFVSGPGGLVSRLMNKPLVIHEQNTIPGMTNRWLAKIAQQVFEAFPESFPKNVNAKVSGNPVRKEIFELEDKEIDSSEKQINLLILGGSLGAQALNELLPQAIALLPDDVIPNIRHQAGKGKNQMTEEAYVSSKVTAEITDFIGNMSEAYDWADLVICRSGALTVSELTAVGVASVLVPFPFAVDDHQTRNGQFLVDSGAAILIQQKELTASSLSEILKDLLTNRERLTAMAKAAKKHAMPNATKTIADACEDLVKC